MKEHFTPTPHPEHALGAAFVSEFTAAGIPIQGTTNTRDPLRDPDLVKVWAPHADEIRKLAD